MGFYTKYRPAKFSEILGQDHVVEILKNQAKGRNFHHAYLMYGGSGTGKTSTARILAMVLNCASLDGTGEPCGECQSCRAIRKGSHWDVQEVDGARFGRVEDMRELVARSHLAPFGGGRKVYIIDEAHMISEAGFNTLLKTLEEPPPMLVLILCTTQADKLPLTVKSRMQLYAFNPLKPLVIRQKLEVIAREQGIELEEEQVKWISESSAGNMRSAENVLEQLCSLKGAKGV